MYMKHQNHTYGSNRNNSANNWACVVPPDLKMLHRVCALHAAVCSLRNRQIPCKKAEVIIFPCGQTKFCSWEMVFCYQNCSDLMWKKIVLLIEKNLQNFWGHWTIYLNSEWSEQFLVTECFFNRDFSHLKNLNSWNSNWNFFWDLEISRKS